MPPRSNSVYRPRLMKPLVQPGAGFGPGQPGMSAGPIQLSGDGSSKKKKKKPPKNTGPGNPGGGNKGGGGDGNWHKDAEKGKGDWGNVTPPPLDPVDALRNSEGHRQLYTSYRDQVALLSNQQQIANRRKQEDLFRNQQSKFGELQSFAGASNERGTLGSSMDFVGRQGIRDQFLSNAQTMRNAWSEGKLGNIAQRMQARRDYETGVLQLKMNKAAQQAMDKIYDEVTNDDDDVKGPGNKPGKDKPGKDKPGKDKPGKDTPGNKPRRYTEPFWDSHKKLRGKTDKQLTRRIQNQREDIREIKRTSDPTTDAGATAMLEAIAKKKKRVGVLKKARKQNDPRSKGGKSTKGGPQQ